jgi:hypothetical protein
MFDQFLIIRSSNSIFDQFSIIRSPNSIFDQLLTIFSTKLFGADRVHLGQGSNRRLPPFPEVTTGGFLATTAQHQIPTLASPKKTLRKQKRAFFAFFVSCGRFKFYFKYFWKE